MKPLVEKKKEVLAQIDDYIQRTRQITFKPNTGLKNQACINRLREFRDSVAKSQNHFVVNTFKARATFYFNGIKKHGS